jgi:membrane protease subunit HflK
MPWQNNDDSSGSSSPWGGSSGSGGGSSDGSGGGSGSGSGGGPKSPWGEVPPRRPAPGRGPTGRGEIDDFLRRGQDRLRSSLPGGGAQLANIPWVLIAAVILGIWLVMTATYRVQAQERGVVLRFGKYIETTGPGFHFKLPSPIDDVVLPKVEQVNSVDIGAGDGASENLMLTGDQNIIDINYAVRWKIRNPELFLFELAEPEQTIREVAEAAMRAEIGRATLNDAIGPQRAQIAEQVRERMQEILDSYRAGIDVRGVDIKQADPPAAVKDAFNDVSAAQQDAVQVINQSKGYAQQLLAVAQGSAAQFNAVYAQYKLAPEVTRKRIYLETMENILSKVDKTVIEPGNVQTYLPLPEVRRHALPAAPAAPATPAQAK